MGKLLKLNEKLDFEVIETESNEVSYEELRNAIGGYFERVTFNRELVDAKVSVFVDDEGKLKDLHPTVAIVRDNGTVIDLLAGPLVFTGLDDPDTPSITDEQIEVVKRVLSKKVFARSRSHGLGEIRIMKHG